MRDPTIPWVAALVPVAAWVLSLVALLICEFTTCDLEILCAIVAVGFVFETTSSDDEDKDWSIAFPSPIPNDTFIKSS